MHLDEYLEDNDTHMFTNELNFEDGYNAPQSDGKRNMYSIATSGSLRTACFVLVLYQLQVSVSSPLVVT
jgi:hypothetical protein